MALEVWTARVSSKDPDAFDITRKTGHDAFAPSWLILTPMIDRRRNGHETTEAQWKEYAAAYYKEMQVSRAANVETWKALLARPRVVLTCYCTNHLRCHRTLLARLLEKLGASFEGELADRKKAQKELFELALSLGEED